jgi:hypothetical protein
VSFPIKADKVKSNIPFLQTHQIEPVFDNLIDLPFGNCLCCFLALFLTITMEVISWPINSGYDEFCSPIGNMASDNHSHIFGAFKGI